MAFSFPNISQNQMFQAGLGLLGSGLRPQQGSNPFLAAQQGLAYGSQLDKDAKEEARLDEEARRRKRLEDAWAGMFGGGVPQQQPGMAQPAPGAPIDLTGAFRPDPQLASAAPDMTGMGGPAMAPQVPMNGMGGPIDAAAAVNPRFLGGMGAPATFPQAAQQAPQGNPMLANVPPQMMPLLAAMGPEKGAQYLFDAMNRKPPERRIIDGADGFKYYEDGTRVLPGVEAKADKPPAGYRVGPDGNLEADPGWLEAQIKLRQAGRPQTNVNVDTVGKTLSPGQKAVDEEFAKDYASFTLGGGYADAAKNLDQINDVIGRLEQGEALTGGLGARLPDWARAYADPEGLDVQQLTEEVIQRNLREVLGAQFTEKEGERLISRAYDARLSPEKNIARLQRLSSAMREGLEARKESAEYFEENGTLKGYKGAKRITIRDLERALKEPEGEAEEQPKRMKYNPATGELEPVS